jgi:single-stranded DNA-binding protein
LSADNQVRLLGKLSRMGSLKFTPSGIAVREGTLAVVQEVLGKETVGYHELLFFGDLAEQEAGVLKVGSRLCVQGVLWQRSYRDRKSVKVSETKVFVREVELAALKI